MRVFVQRVIERELPQVPLVPPRGFVLFPSYQNSTVVRPDFPRGLTLVGGGDELEVGRRVGQRYTTTLQK